MKKKKKNLTRSFFKCLDLRIAHVDHYHENRTMYVPVPTTGSISASSVNLHWECTLNVNFYIGPNFCACTVGENCQTDEIFGLPFLLRNLKTKNDINRIYTHHYLLDKFAFLLAECTTIGLNTHTKRKH